MDDIVYDVLPVIEKFLAEGVTEKAVIIERLGQEKKSVMERIGQEKNPASEEQLAEAVEEILELRDAGMLLRKIFMRNILRISGSGRRLLKRCACISPMTATLPVNTALRRKGNIMEGGR